MKEIIVLLSVMLIFESGKAQRNSFMLQFGMTLPDRNANIYPFNKPLSKDSHKYTFTPGFAYKYRANKYLSVKSGLLLEERGWLQQDWVIDPNNGNTKVVEVDYYYSFLTMPLIIQGSIGNEIRLEIGTGFYTSMRLDGGTRIGKDEVITLGFIYPRIETPEYDISYAIEAGGSVKINQNIRLVLEGSYFTSLTPIGKYTDFETEIYHKGFRILLGIERGF